MNKTLNLSSSKFYRCSPHTYKYINRYHPEFDRGFLLFVSDALWLAYIHIPQYTKTVLIMDEYDLCTIYSKFKHRLVEGLNITSMGNILVRVVKFRSKTYYLINSFEE